MGRKASHGGWAQLTATAPPLGPGFVGPGGKPPFPPREGQDGLTHPQGPGPGQGPELRDLCTDTRRVNRGSVPPRINLMPSLPTSVSPRYLYPVPSDTDGPTGFGGRVSGPGCGRRPAPRRGGRLHLLGSALTRSCVHGAPTGQERNCRDAWRVAVSWVAGVSPTQSHPSGGSGCLGHPTPEPWGLEQPTWRRQPLPDTSGGWLSPLPPQTPGQNARRPRTAALVAPPREVLFPQSWAGPGASLPRIHPQVDTHPLTTAEPRHSEAGNTGCLNVGDKGGAEEGAGRPGWDSQRLQARQLPQRLGGDASQLVVLQHPVRRGGAWRTHGMRSWGASLHPTPRRSLPVTPASEAGGSPGPAWPVCRGVRGCVGATAG